MPCSAKVELSSLNGSDGFKLSGAADVNADAFADLIVDNSFANGARASYVCEYAGGSTEIAGSPGQRPAEDVMAADAVAVAVLEGAGSLLGSDLLMVQRDRMTIPGRQAVFHRAQGRWTPHGVRAQLRV